MQHNMGGGVYDIVVNIDNNVSTLLSGGNVPLPFGTSQVELDETYSFGVSITDIDGEIVPSANITAGSYNYTRIRDGVSVASSWSPSSKTDGRVYVDYTFSSGTWAVGDTFVISFRDIVVTQGGTTTQIPTKMIFGRVTELPAIATNVSQIRTLLDGGPNDLAQIRADIAALPAGGDISALEAKIDTIDGIVDAIKLKTDTIPANTAETGDEMTLTAGTITSIRSGLALTTHLQEVENKVDAISTLQGGVDGLAAIKADTAATRTLAEGASGFAAIKTQLNTAAGDALAAKNYADILDDASNGLVAIHDRLKRAERQIGENLVLNSGFDTDTSGWTLSNSSGQATMARSTAAGTYRQNGASLQLVGQGNDRVYYAANGRRALGGRVYCSAWVFSTESDIPISLSTEYCTPASILGVTVANTWVQIEGIFKYSSNTAELRARVFVGFNEAGAVNKTIYIDDVVMVYLDDTWHDFHMRRALHKNASLTYDPATDSLEALRDRIDAIYGAAATATIQQIYDKVVQSKVTRDGDSGSTVMDGTEQTLFEYASTVPWCLRNGRIDLSGLADGRTFVIRLYQKCKSGGSYRLQSTVTLTGAADAQLYEIPAQLPIGGTSYKANVRDLWNTFGLKVTLQQTAKIGDEAYQTVDHEWYRSEES